MNDIVFFQAIGRSGTQWFAHQLAETYADLLTVTHEPIQYAYQPNRFLRRHSAEDQAALQQIPEVAEHLRYIDEVSEERIYVEVGFPSYAAIPMLRTRYGDRLKLVHLVRNPVPNALSQVTHGWYDPVKRQDMAQDILLTPDDNVVQTYYAPDWAQMSQLEKCFFFWSEFHLYAQELHLLYPGMPFFRIRFEDIFASADYGSWLQRLTSFIGLPWRPEMLEGITVKEDKWHLQVAAVEDWHSVFKHPQTLALARQYGYDLNAITNREISLRYVKHVTLGQRIRRKTRTLLTRLH